MGRRKRKPKRGGLRAGAGRPTLFDGKVVRLTIMQTERGQEIVSKYEEEHRCSKSDVVEWALRCYDEHPVEPPREKES